jgi:hypothetical protein
MFFKKQRLEMGEVTQKEGEMSSVSRGRRAGQRKNEL